MPCPNLLKGREQGNKQYHGNSQVSHKNLKFQAAFFDVTANFTKNELFKMHYELLLLRLMNGMLNP
jgi:hypothetical protein